MATKEEMAMRIAIANGGGFAERWEQHCRELELDYTMVNPHDTNLVEFLRRGEYTHFLWHWLHFVPEDQLCARQIIASLQMAGVKVFPDMNTCWHFDDKLGQKYLLEAMNLPLAKTWVFYSRESALEWAETACYPVVFKLRAGAASKNVKLVRDFRSARRFIRTMFSSGIPAANVRAQLAGSIKKMRKSPLEMLRKLKRMPSYIHGVICRRMLPRQVGYCLFQEFIPGNTFDTRIVVIGDRAIGIRRKVRENDFRASGSGLLDYDANEISLECVKMAFKSARMLQTQSLALDFVYDGRSNEYQIVEISYGYSVKAYYKCPGYWDSGLNWHDADVYPEDWILDDLLADNNERR